MADDNDRSGNFDLSRLRLRRNESNSAGAGVPTAPEAPAAPQLRSSGATGESSTTAPTAPLATTTPSPVSPASQAPTVSDRGTPSPSLLDVARKHILPILEKRISTTEVKQQPRGTIARKVQQVLSEWLAATGQELNLIDQRNMVTFLVNTVFERVRKEFPDARTGSETSQALATSPDNKMNPQVGYSVGSVNLQHKETVLNAKSKVQPVLMNRIDTTAAATLPRNELQRQIEVVIAEILLEQKVQLNKQEKQELVQVLLNDMLGLGPLEPLLNDPTITDIMVNGPNQTFVEKNGKLVLTDVKFRDNQHLINISTRIVSAIGRRVDESSPMCDARLLDGSRVNIVIPPLAIDGPSLSIRKFSSKAITLPMMVQTGNLSAEMATVLQIAGRCRLNIIISGGTGAGKTTLLNALSNNIGADERVVTVEDSAELKLQQAHVVRLETRAANLEGDGEITIRDLIKNALRMRPDRIIVGECRGAEIIDMLQAMNTGHDGSMSTIHANNPRTALTRMENMLNMAGFNMPEKVTRSMISSAVNLIVQISRMRDGVRRISHIMEVVGMEESTVMFQDLFWYEFQEETADGKLLGKYVSSGLRPHFTKRAEYYGLSKPLIEAMG
ncbi:MAG: CpaF family protein [Holosporales bacterium]